ncbi:hypothetical protein PAMP_000185 [Pampus punctatissimus]
MELQTDIDECATQMHYCQSNTVCVNLPGSHRCDCLPGFIRVDEYSCTVTQDRSLLSSHHVKVSSSARAEIITIRANIITHISCCY